MKKVFQKGSAIFNIADIFIAIGVILFMISNIKKQNEKWYKIGIVIMTKTYYNIKYNTKYYMIVFYSWGVR